MAKSVRFCLGAVGLLVLSAVFAPSCHAQLPFTDGTWEGVETYTDTEYVNNQQITETTETVWGATLTIQIYSSLAGSPYGAEVVLSMIDTNISGDANLSLYGSDGNGLSGSIVENIYHYEFGFAYFDAIPGSYADATFTGEYGGVDGTFSSVMAFFQTAPEASAVPEPSAFTEAALAIVSLSVFWCARRVLAGWSVTSAVTKMKLV